MLKQGAALLTACLLYSNLAYGQKELRGAVRAYSGTTTTGCQKAGVSRQLRKRSAFIVMDKIRCKNFNQRHTITLTK